MMMSAQPERLLELRMLTVSQWQENCYLLVDPQTSESLLIDPGAEAGRILDWASDTTVRAILLTHADVDHVGALDETRAKLNVRVGMHPADTELATKNDVAADYELNEGDVIQLGAHEIRVVFTPGHTAGSISLLFDSRAIVGDAVFPGGPGRTRSPEAFVTSLATLQRTVFIWPDETTLYPGHGVSTTVGKERPAFEAFLTRPRPNDLQGDVTWDS